MTYELNPEHIQAAAHWAAERILGTWEMRPQEFAFVLLEPGDANRYPISIIGNVPVFTGSEPDYRRPNEYRVTVHADFGRSYLWCSDNSYITADYCTDKWANGRGQVQTGIVLAAFLNALYTAMRALKDREAIDQEQSAMESVARRG